MFVSVCLLACAFVCLFVLSTAFTLKGLSLLWTGMENVQLNIKASEWCRHTAAVLSLCDQPVELCLMLSLRVLSLWLGL